MQTSRGKVPIEINSGHNVHLTSTMTWPSWFPYHYARLPTKNATSRHTNRPAYPTKGGHSEQDDILRYVTRTLEVTGSCEHDNGPTGSTHAPPPPKKKFDPISDYYLLKKKCATWSASLIGIRNLYLEPFLKTKTCFTAYDTHTIYSGQPQGEI